MRGGTPRRSSTRGRDDHPTEGVVGRLRVSSRPGGGAFPGWRPPVNSGPQDAHGHLAWLTCLFERAASGPWLPGGGNRIRGGAPPTATPENAATTQPEHSQHLSDEVARDPGHRRDTSSTPASVPNTPPDCTMLAPEFPADLAEVVAKWGHLSKPKRARVLSLVRLGTSA